MVRHSIGDKVICIDNKHHRPDLAKYSSSTSLKLNEEYEVYDIEYCSKCGEQKIYVGFVMQMPVKNILCPCNHSTPARIGDVAFHLSKRFVKKQELTNEEEEAMTKEIEESLKISV